MLGWLALFVIVPTLMLLVISFCERDALGRIVYSFTFENYIRAFDWKWLKILGISVWYAFLTTAICLVLGYPVAYFIGRSSERVRGLLIMLVMIPFWTSFLIRTYAWISILSQDGLLNALLMTLQITSAPIGFMYTPFAVILGLVYNFLPFMILPIYTSVEKLDGSLIEAAYDLGARPARVFSKVVLPLTQPGIAAGQSHYRRGHPEPIHPGPQPTLRRRPWSPPPRHLHLQPLAEQQVPPQRAGVVEPTTGLEPVTC